MEPHLPRVGIQGHVRRPPSLEGVCEVAGPTTDIEQQAPVQPVPTVDLRGRIPGEMGVEAIGVALLAQERPEQSCTSTPTGPERLGRVGALSGWGGHLPTVPHDVCRSGLRRLRPGRYGEAVHIVVLNWRDTSNPEGGGSEVYIEELARRWARDGHRVTLVCAAHGRAPSLEERHGIRIVRVGNKLTVYSSARRLLRRGALGSVDVVVDTQNGIPFFARWATSSPTVMLVHHVHREQWPVVYGPARARVGWFIESVAAPRALRGLSYVAVSQATRRELIAQGIASESIAVVHNGTADLPPVDDVPDAQPRILVLGRLVPHKRVEHVLVAASILRVRHPGLTVAVVGDGWWAPHLQEAARRHGVEDLVDFTGQVDEVEKARQIARAWVLALPSLKEGWGLVILEAASRGVPAVAYAEAGGVTESIVHGDTGLLVAGGEPELAAALGELLADDERRWAMGSRARAHAERFSWDASAETFMRVLDRAVQAHHPRDHATGQSGYWVEP